MQPGDTILDIGCGIGRDARELARRVGVSGRIVGLDCSEAALAEARAGASGLPVEYVVGDAHHLPFADDAFDGCRADRVFHHLEDPRLALADMVRVIRPGASLVIIEPDYETLLVDVPNRALTRKILNFRCDSVIRHGWIGRQLWGYCRELGLADIVVEPAMLVLTEYVLAEELFRLSAGAQLAQEVGVVSAAEAAGWRNNLKEADRAGRFFLALAFFMLSGRKP